MAPRKSASMLPLCEDLSVKYTVSVSRSATAGGYINRVKFYLYSQKAKCEVGASVTASIKTTQKQLLSAKGARPEPTSLTPNQQQEYLARLIKKNIGISPTVQNCKKVPMELDTNQLFIYWLVHGDYLRERFWPLQEKWIAAIMHFARISATVGSFDLTQLLAPDTAAQGDAVRSIASLIRAALKKKSDDKTLPLWQSYARTLTALMTVYLEEHDRSLDLIDKFRKELIPRQGIVSKTGEAMRSNVLPLARQRQILLSLLTSPTQINIAVLFMFFLGLSAEEVCGLDMDDCVAIKSATSASSPASVYQLYITKRFVKTSSKAKYELTDYMEDAWSYRVIPMPYELAQHVIPKLRVRVLDGQPLFSDEKNKRLTPDKLIDTLAAVVNASENTLSVIVDNGKRRQVDLSFSANAYKLNCRHFWQYYCGLTQGEIRHLAGLTPVDTASLHYIDYNNEVEQMRISAQINYGLVQLKLESRPTKTEKNSLSELRYSFMSGSRSRTYLRVELQEACHICIRSGYGVTLRTESPEEGQK